MSGIEQVVIVDQWVSADLSTSVFDDADRQRILDDIDQLEAHLVT